MYPASTVSPTHCRGGVNDVDHQSLILADNLSKADSAGLYASQTREAAPYSVRPIRERPAPQSWADLMSTVDMIRQWDLMDNDDDALAPEQYSQQDSAEASSSLPKHTYPPRKVLPELPNGGTEKHHVAWCNPRTLDTNVQNVRKQATNLAREQPLEATRVILSNTGLVGAAVALVATATTAGPVAIAASGVTASVAAGTALVTSAKAIQDQKKRVRPRVKEPQWVKHD